MVQVALAAQEALVAQAVQAVGTILVNLAVQAHLAPQVVQAPLVPPVLQELLVPRELPVHQAQVVDITLVDLTGQVSVHTVILAVQTTIISAYFLMYMYMVHINIE